MQHVTAFSPPQTVPAAPVAGRKPNLWILDGWRDLILYVCTPLVILPIFIVAQARWSAEDIYLFVAAFGTMGSPLTGDDSRLRRSCVIPALQVPLDFCTDFFGGRLHGVFFVGSQSLPRRGIAMASSWRNMRGWKRQLPSIGRLCRLTRVLSMPISISRARFSQRASWRKQRRITWRPPGSTRSLRPAS